VADRPKPLKVDALDEPRALDVQSRYQPHLGHASASRCAGLMPDGMLELPSIVGLAPQVIRAPAIDDSLKLFIGYAAIVQEVPVVFLGELAIIAADQCDAFLPGDLVVANFMRRIRGRSTYAELYEAQIVMEAVNLVVEAGVLRISPLRPFGIGLEAGVLPAIVEVFLRVPANVVAQKMNLGL